MRVKNEKSNRSSKNRTKKIVKFFGIIVGFLIIFTGGIYLLFQYNPIFQTALIKYEFDKGGIAASDALKKHVPAGIKEKLDINYGDTADEKLDIFYPESLKSEEKLPVVFWVHGGAWVSGDKNQMTNYLKIIASKGYAVVSPNYTLAPKAKYPEPTNQINKSLQFLSDNKNNLRINTDNIILAGDSAGAHISAQIAMLSTNTEYANELGIKPAIKKDQIAGTILACGPFDLSLVKLEGGTFDKFLRTILWAYTGSNDLTIPSLATVSLTNYVTEDFPPTLITAGNKDFLLKHSEKMAKKLNEKKVENVQVFFAENHQPELQHEYQFNLDQKDGKNFMKKMEDFLESQTRK